MNNESEPQGPQAEEKPTKALRKKQQREERQQLRDKERLTAQRKKQVRRALLWGIPVILIALGAWAIVRSPKTSNDDNPLISRRGIHWHPNIEITIKGERVMIPANIGLGGIHADTHTHKENDQIHLEMSRPVRERDTRLAKFFETWGEEFNSQCILVACNGEDGNVKMLVNDEENFEFENYHMKDGDRIEIRYE
jgi:hypothetical protein